MQKLKISDLSVGDWVQWNDKTYRVCLIDGVSLTVELAEEAGGTIEVAIDEVTGIPLTTEILEKNGFELCEWDWIGHDYRCIVQQRGGYWDVLSNKRGYYRTIRIDGLECVHELQHAIRLAGIEKEIEL